MPKPTHYKFSDFEHRLHELPPGKSYIRSHIGPHNSDSMMAGWNFFNDVKVPWSLTCDEVIFVFQGTFRMVVDGEASICKPGARMMHSTDIMAEARAVSVPAMVMCGSADTVTPEALARTIAAAIPGAAYNSLPGLGHASYVENSDIFDAPLRDFIGGIA